MRNPAYCTSVILVAMAALCIGQGVEETSVPLGKALEHALYESSLTTADAKPFHLRVRLFESTNPSSDYTGEVEEYWISPKQWRRSINTPEFKQTLIVNGGQISEQDAGDYYPLWLKSFITAIFDPVPDAEQWNKFDAKINQITLPNGLRSEPCARMKFKVGSETVKNDAFSNICFDNNGLLKFFGSPGYSMEFHDYQRFGKKMVARRYQDDPEPGTEIVANVLRLQELDKPDESLFLISQNTPLAQQLQSVRVEQRTIEEAAEGQPAIVWPPVQSGNITGLLTMYISVDRRGQVREAYPLNSDNADLQDSAREQLLKWKLKPLMMKGVPVQAEAALSFRFETTLASKPTEAPPTTVSPDNASSQQQPVKISPGLVKGFLVSSPAPEYPPEAKKGRIQGKVVLSLMIDHSGVPQDIRVLSSPFPALTDAAIAAVSKWRYQPYLLNGSPVSVRSTVEVNFVLP
jgi:TonB family protein